MSDNPKVSPHYAGWRERPTKRNLSKLLGDYDRLIKGEALKYKGTLATTTLFAKAKIIAIDAVRSYDPGRNTALSTHIVSNMRRLHRVNYEATRAVRLPEDIQRGVGAYLSARGELENRLNREPSAVELADELKWPINRVNRTLKSVKGEALESELTFEPGIITPQYENTKIDYVYHDLNPRDQIIFEHTTGYQNKPIMKKKDIAKKLRLSPAIISQRSTHIAKRLQEGLRYGHGFR